VGRAGVGVLLLLLLLLIITALGGIIIARSVGVSFFFIAYREAAWDVVSIV
jgi:UPF0716 family protein affecting phage T7 exclusion